MNSFSDHVKVDTKLCSEHAQGGQLLKFKVQGYALKEFVLPSRASFV